MSQCSAATRLAPEAQRPVGCLHAQHVPAFQGGDGERERDLGFNVFSLGAGGAAFELVFGGGEILTAPLAVEGCVRDIESVKWGGSYISNPLSYVATFAD